MANSIRVKNIFYVFIITYVVVAAIALFIAPVKISWDPALSLKMTDNGLKHIPFNNYQHPNTHNLDQDQNEFINWWSPGQYALPMVIEHGLNVKLSIAIKILTAFCLILAAIGIFKLYNKLLADTDSNTNPVNTAYIALIFTLLQPFFWKGLFFYEGGGILMLAYCPWFLHWLISKRINVKNLGFLLALSLIGFFLKSSFSGIFLGALLYLFIINTADNFKQKLNIQKIAVNAVTLGLVLAVYLLILKTAFLSHNRNISDSALRLRLQARVFAYPIIAPVFKIFALDALNKTIYWLAGLIFVIPFYYLIFRNPAINNHYKRIVFSFAGATLIFYCPLYLVQVDVSYELRHFVVISLLLIPALFVLIFSCKQQLKPLFITILGLYICFNIFCFGREFGEALKDKTATGYSGFALNYPQELIDKIHQLDRTNTNAGKDIFCFDNKEPCMALEVQNNRVLLKDNFLNTHFVNIPTQKMIYQGRNSGDLYIILTPQVDSADGLSRFRQYNHFEKVYQVSGYSIFKSAGAK